MKRVLLLCFTAASLLAFSPDNDAKFRELAGDKDPDKRIKAIELAKGEDSLKSAQMIATFLADPHPKVCWRAVKALSAMKDGKAIEWLAKGALKAQSEVVRARVAEALGMMKNGDAIDALLDALKDSSPQVRAEAYDAIATIGDGAIYDKVRDRVEKESHWFPRATGIEALVTLDAGKSADIVKKGASDKAYQVRLVAAEAMAQIGKEDAFGLLPALVNDGDWRVRSAAIESCGAIQEPICVEFLVGRFPLEKGRLRWDILKALKRLTAKELGLDPKAWKKWWDENKLSFQPVGKKVEVKKGHSEGETEVEPLKMDDKTVVEFCGIPILSNRAAFVLDLSGSMRDEMKDDDADNLDEKTKTRLDVAKREIGATIASFPPDVFFNIFLLGSDRNGGYDRTKKVWRPNLVQASDEGKGTAIKFIGRQEARGWTNIFDAVAFAFEDPNVDTIYLYSDGGASRGIFVATNEIIHHLRQLNRFRRIMVHTIEIEASAKDNKRLMRELAGATGGCYMAK